MQLTLAGVKQKAADGARFHVKQHPEPLSTLTSLGERKVALLTRYVEFLDRWRKVTNLISSRSFSEVWERHVADSIYVQQASPSSLRWLDLGTGAGFPGIVIGVCLADTAGAEVHCVESDGKKCAFLRLVAQSLELPVKVHNRRAETLTPEVTGPIDAITSRAFSSISDILEFTRDYMIDDAVAILPRGATYAHEVVSLAPNRYIVKVDPNPGHKDGFIVTIRERGKENHAGTVAYREC